MGHRLIPTDQSAGVTLTDLVGMLRESFASVHANREAGADHIGDMIAQYLRMKEGYERWKTPPPKLAEVTTLIDQLDRQRDNAAFVTVADDDHDDDRTVSFNLVPGQEIVVGYANAGHEDAATELTLRVADALGYTAERL